MLAKVGPVSHIFMAGGFSESEVVKGTSLAGSLVSSLNARTHLVLCFLRFGLRAHCMSIKAAIEASIGPKVIRIITPPHAALAVLTGAVLYGLKPKSKLIAALPLSRLRVHSN